MADQMHAFLEQYCEAARLFARGDPEDVKANYSHADDVVLANPFGPASVGWDAVSPALDFASSRFQDGDVDPLFFRRAERIDLDGIADSQAAVALRGLILNGGRTIGPAALQAAVEGAEGYPFLVQLVGMQSWRVDRDSTEITLEHVREGIDRAHERMGVLVHEIALQDVPEAQRAYLAAMAVDDSPSSTGEIARRLDLNAQHANVFRDRLIKDAELITSDGRGFVDFALPYLREYMREQPAFEPFADQRHRIDEREAPDESRPDRSVSHERRTTPRRAGDRSGPDHNRG